MKVGNRLCTAAVGYTVAIRWKSYETFIIQKGHDQKTLFNDMQKETKLAYVCKGVQISFSTWNSILGLMSKVF